MKQKILLFLSAFILFISVKSFSQVIVTDVGTGTYGYNGDNIPAISAELSSVYGITLDDSGNLYICDQANRRIRKVSPGYGGTITTIAGNGTSGYSGDNGLGIYAQIQGGYDIAVDKNENIYFTDEGNNCIRKITRGDTITTIAGTGVAGYNGDGILATSAQLNGPIGVTADNIGNIYIADYFNSRIRKVDTMGIITTIAGTGVPGFSPDGSLADTAKVDSVFSVRIDKNDDLFFEDFNNRIRKIDTTGIITTIAGNGIVGFSGDSGLATAAEIGSSGAIAFDTSGNLYLADFANSRIREINTSGIIYTIAGDGLTGFGGDYGPPLSAKIDPSGVAVSNNGDVYISDLGNYRIRLVTDHPLSTPNVIAEQHIIKIFPNPSAGAFSCLVSSATGEQAVIVITNIFGSTLAIFFTATNQELKIQLQLSPGIYFLSATTAEKQYNEKIIIQ